MGSTTAFLRSLTNNPKRILTWGILLNVALVPIISAFVWTLFATFARVGTEGLELQRLVGTISHLNEVSTMSARLAAVTGDPRWAARYRKVEPELDEAIAALAMLARAEYEKNYAAQAKLAYGKLIEMENLAFALVRNGRKEEAADLLFSHAYETAKKQHSQALRDLTHAVQKSIAEEIDSFRSGIWKAGATVLAGTALLLLTWLIVLLALKRHLAERKQSEQLVFAEKERLLVTLQSIGDAVITSDTLGNVVLMNPAAEGLIGLSQQVATGKRISDLFDIVQEASGEKTENPVNYVLRTGDAYQLSNSTILIAGKQAGKYIEQGASPIRDRDGTISGVVLVIRDVTARKQLETQVRQAAKMEAMGTLAGGIAHDFNNILYVIMGYAELCLDQAPQDSRLNLHLEQVLAATSRAKALVDQILTFSRQRDQQKQVIRISPILKEALKFLRASVPSTVEIRQVLDARTETIMADPTQVHQVLMNLCTNASHAMRDRGGVMEVRLDNGSPNGNGSDRSSDSELCGYLRLSVSDTGHGMSQEVMERIFEPYFTTKDKTQGTGLGLSVVHGIVRDHGGSMDVWSEVGKGSRFQVYFPLACQDVDMSARDGAPLTAGTGEHILLVDDERSVIEMAKEMLQRLGYRVSAEYGSMDALSLFSDDPRQFDLVITDLTMPKMTGRELARELLRIRPDIPIVLCTGFSELVSEEQVKEWGLAALLTKPVSSRTMAATIRNVLDDA